MTSKKVLEAMASGAILCMGWEGEEQVYWLEPKRVRVRSDVATVIIALPGVISGGDSLFKDAPAQTWRMRKKNAA